VRPEALIAAILRQAVTDADYDLYREKVITLRKKYDFETEKRREKP
jgi:hypothetical protein